MDDELLSGLHQRGRVRAAEHGQILMERLAGAPDDPEAILKLIGDALLAMWAQGRADQSDEDLAFAQIDALPTPSPAAPDVDDWLPQASADSTQPVLDTLFTGLHELETEAQLREAVGLALHKAFADGAFVGIRYVRGVLPDGTSWRSPPAV